MSAIMRLVLPSLRYHGNQFLGGQVTDSRTLVNGARGKTLIAPLSPGHIALVNYCEKHMDLLVLDAVRNVFGTDQ
jgi:hypothetical protein